MIVSAIELNRWSPLPVKSWVAARASRLRPSIGGEIFQTSGATIRVPGILRRSSSHAFGQVAEDRGGRVARITISPFMRASVLPISVRMPLVRLKSPRIAMIGIVSPNTASKRAGRPSNQVLPGKSPHETSLVVRSGARSTSRPGNQSNRILIAAKPAPLKGELAARDRIRVNRAGTCDRSPTSIRDASPRWHGRCRLSGRLHSAGVRCRTTGFRSFSSTTSRKTSGRA